MGRDAVVARPRSGGLTGEGTPPRTKDGSLRDRRRSEDCGISSVADAGESPPRCSMRGAFCSAAVVGVGVVPFASCTSFDAASCPMSLRSNATGVEWGDEGEAGADRSTCVWPLSCLDAGAESAAGSTAPLSVATETASLSSWASGCRSEEDEDGVELADGVERYLQTAFPLPVLLERPHWFLRSFHAELFLCLMPAGDASAVADEMGASQTSAPVMSLNSLPGSLFGLCSLIALLVVVAFALCLCLADAKSLLALLPTSLDIFTTPVLTSCSPAITSLLRRVTSSAGGFGEAGNKVVMQPTGIAFDVARNEEYGCAEEPPWSDSSALIDSIDELNVMHSGFSEDASAPSSLESFST